MRTIAKLAAIVIASLVGLLSVGLVVLSLTSDEWYRDTLAAGIKSATGRHLSIDGEFRVHLFPALAVSATEVRFANAGWGSRPDMLSVQRLEAKLALRPLLQGVARIAVYADAPEIFLETSASGEGNWQMGTPRASAPAERGEPGIGGLPVRLVPDVRLAALRFQIRDGASANQTFGEVGSLVLTERDGELVVELDGRLDGNPFIVTGSLGRLDDYFANRATSLALEGELDKARLSLSGPLGPLRPSPRAQIDLRLQAASIASLARYGGAQIPELGALGVSGRIEAADRHWALRDLRADLAGDHASLSATGTVADLLRRDGIELSLQAETQAPGELLSALGVLLPGESPSSVEVAATLSGSLQRLGVADLRATVLGEGLEAVLTGAVQDVLSQRGLSAEVDVKVASLAGMSRYAGASLPELGALSLTGRFSAAGLDGEASVSAQLAGDGFVAEAQGSLAEPWRGQGIDVEADVEVASLAVLSSLAGTDLPDVGPLRVRAGVLAADGIEGPADVNVGIEAEGVSALAEVSIDDVRTAARIDGRLSLKSPSLARLGALVGRELPERGPVGLGANVHARPHEYRLDDLLLNIADDEVRGVAAFLPAAAEGGQRPRLTARLDIASLDLGAFLPELEAAAEAVEAEAKVQVAKDRPEKKGDAPSAAAPQTAEKQARPQPVPGGLATMKAEGVEGSKKQKKRVFPTDPLPFEVLRGYDADIAVAAKRLELFGKYGLTDMDATLLLEDGNLRFGPVNARGSHGGTIEGTVNLDAGTDIARLSMDVDFGKIIVPFLDGVFDLEAQGEGRGGSVAELLGGLNGRIVLLAREGHITRSFLTGFGTDLLDSLLPHAERQQTRLDCLVVRLDVEGGKIALQDRVAMQTTEVTWFFAGDIDLATEEIKIGASPKPRSGVGISAGSLATLVFVDGTLGEPRIRLNPTDVAKKYAGYLVALQTGGLSILAQGLLDKRKANVDVCAKYLEGTQFD